MFGYPLLRRRSVGVAAEDIRATARRAETRTVGRGGPTRTWGSALLVGILGGGHFVKVDGVALPAGG